MQIDGHHAGTYVCARLAGFTDAEAKTIAYAAQYVDDATNEGVIQFANSEFLYMRIASAHSMIDPSNLMDAKNHLAWLPFHFLPGNDQLPAGQTPVGGELTQMACKPDSPVARDMLRRTLADKGTARGLHRLGIAMHVYADTFSHQGFIGALSPGNICEKPTSGDLSLDKRIKDASKKELWERIWNGLKTVLIFFWISTVMMIRERKSLIRYWRDIFKTNPLGHAAADTFPDQPFLKWSYQDWSGTTVHRDNPKIFMEAFEMMTKAMQAWRADDRTMNLSMHSGINKGDAISLERLVLGFRDPKGKERHLQWLDAIRKGAFSFGAENVEYVAKDAGSWKEAALGTVKKRDNGYELYPFSTAFLSSDWKLFHDALQAHRLDIVHEILPSYGICAA
jgi:hypothetical protein